MMSPALRKSTFQPSLEVEGETTDQGKHDATLGTGELAKLATSVNRETKRGNLCAIKTPIGPENDSATT